MFPHIALLLQSSLFPFAVFWITNPYPFHLWFFSILILYFQSLFKTPLHVSSISINPPPPLPLMASEAGGGGSGGGDETPLLSPRSKLKFLCSYGGKILPRPTDGHLKYVGGETRVIAMPRDIKFPGFCSSIFSPFFYLFLFDCDSDYVSWWVFNLMIILLLLVDISEVLSV